MKKLFLIIILITVFTNCSSNKNQISDSTCIVDYDFKNGREVYTKVDVEPKLIAETDFVNYFLERIITKESYVDDKPKLKFAFEFNIEKKGKVSSVNFINKKGKELNDIENDAVEIIMNTNWKPAKCNGREVVFLKKVNIFFNLD